MLKSLAMLALLVLPVTAGADVPKVVDAEVTRLADRMRVDVTISHPDTGWDHYADGWQVLDDAGNLLGTRELAHPHVNEQPFTRSLTLPWPEGTSAIHIRPRGNVHGLAEDSVRVPLN